MAGCAVNGIPERLIPKQSPKLKLVLAIAIVNIGTDIQATLAQPTLTAPTQWKQSVERPSRRWDYDGQRILGYVNHDIFLWSATTGKQLQKMQSHKDRIAAVQFSPDGNHILSSSWRRPGPMQPVRRSESPCTILWNITTGEIKQVLEAQVAGEFSPDGRRIVTFGLQPDDPGAFDAIIWDAFSGRQLAKAKLDKYADPHRDALHFTPDGQQFVHMKNGAFLLYNTSEGILYETNGGCEVGRVAVKYGAHRYISCNALASFDADRAMLIKLNSNQIVKSTPHNLGVVDAVWAHDGSRIAAIPSDKEEILFWSFKSGKVTSEAKCGPQRKRAAIVSPDNARLAVEWGGANYIEPEMGLYDMNTGEEIARMKLPTWGHLLGFSPDSKTLLVGGSEFVIYNADDGREIRSFELLDKVSFSQTWSD